jgi:hypothetical protein
MDDAEVNLKKAVAVRNTAGSAFDAAVSRENSAQLYEIRGETVQVVWRSRSLIRIITHVSSRVSDRLSACYNGGNNMSFTYMLYQY